MACQTEDSPKVQVACEEIKSDAGEMRYEMSDEEFKQEPQPLVMQASAEPEEPDLFLGALNNHMESEPEQPREQSPEPIKSGNSMSPSPINEEFEPNQAVV